MVQSPTIPSWEHAIRTHMALSTHSIQTGSTLALHAFSTGQVVAAAISDPVDVPDSTKQALHEINVGTANAVPDGAQSWSNNIQNSSAQDVPAWKQAILDANKKTIDNFTQKVNDAGEAAIAKISDLPNPAEQNAAAGLYQIGANVVNTLINQAAGAFQQALNWIEDFFKHIWDKVVGVWNSCKDWCSSAINALGSIFHISSLMMTPGYAGVSGLVESFQGQVAWKADAAKDAQGVFAQFDKLVTAAANNTRIAVHGLSLDLEEVPGYDLCYVGRVSIASKFKNPEGHAMTLPILSDMWTDILQHLASGFIDLSPWNAMPGQPTTKLSLPNTNMASAGTKDSYGRAGVVGRKFPIRQSAQNGYTFSNVPA